MSVSDDLTGQVFYNLTVLYHIRGSVWMCSCACGNLREVTSGNLTGNKIRSCGCLKYKRKHGYCTKEKNRGRNSEYRIYADYGERGITVCERWCEFGNFFADMGSKPQNYTLERRDNNLGYSPDNCY